MTFLEYLELTAQRSGLGDLLQSNMATVLTALLIFSVLCCLMGFKVYRVGMSAMAFLSILLFAFTFLLPAWGKNKCVTFCAVLGVAVSGGIFFAAKLDAVALAALFTGSLVWMSLEGGSMPLWQMWTITILAGMAAGILAFNFPFVGACVFSALWGGFTAVSILFGNRAQTMQWIVGLGLAEIGAIMQLIVFRKQQVFKKVKPDWLTHRMEKRKVGKGA